MLYLMSETLKSALLQNNLCLSQNMNGTDKEFPKMYISQIYDPFIGKFKKLEFNFVEIGVRTGASVQLWSQYFEEMNFIGIDNEVDVVWQNADWVRGKNVRYLKADAYCHETLSELPDEMSVVIDDGPHSITSQIWLARHYTPHLSVNGFIFIEDIQGGLWYCDKIIRAVPKSFGGCVRIIDLRKLSGEGDSLVILIHNCSGACSLDDKYPNQYEHWPTFLRLIYFEQIKFVFSRLIVKIAGVFK
jgi:hypothetical protein